MVWPADEPFFTTIQAIIKAHATNTMFNNMLADTSSAQRLRMQLNNVNERGLSTVAEAKRHPHDPQLQRSIMNLLCCGLTCVRSMIVRNTPDGVLRHEAHRLQRSLAPRPIT